MLSLIIRKGIESAMKLWEVDDVDIMNFLSTQDISLLNGSTESNLEKVAIQRWLLNYTNGFEAWSIVRDMGYPKTLFDGVSDPEIFGVRRTEWSLSSKNALWLCLHTTPMERIQKQQIVFKGLMFKPQNYGGLRSREIIF